MEEEANKPTMIPITERTGLANYDAACRRVAAASTTDEVNEILDASVRMRLYARQAENKQMEANAWAIRMRAVRRLGEMLEEGKGDRAAPGRPRNGLSRTLLPTLGEIGIGKTIAQEARKAAAVSKDEHESLVDDGRTRIMAKGAKPVPTPKRRKEAASKVPTYGRASADLAALFKITGLDEQRIALQEAGLTDRRILTMAPGGNDDSGGIDYALVELLKGQMGIDELLIAAASYDLSTFRWLAEGFIQLMLERLGNNETLELIEGNLPT